MSKPTKSSIDKIRTADEIYGAMSHMFQDAQFSVSGHKKLIVMLNLLFEKACSMNGGELFSHDFTQLVNRILPIKKGERRADCVVKFCASFVGSLARDTDEFDENTEEESDGARFTSYLILHLLRGARAVDKNVRYRVVQLLANVMPYVGEISASTYEVLYTTLIDKLSDKEIIVRVQAVDALSRLQDADTNDGEVLQAKLQEALSDASAEVRRAALLNLHKNPVTLPSLLARVRDVNGINRRLIFSRTARELGDFRSLDPQVIESLLASGFNDREVSVREAATRLVTTHWFRMALGDIYEWLGGLHVTTSKVAEKALLSLFESAPEHIPKDPINSDYLHNLTVERAFFMRVYYFFCAQQGLYDLIDAKFPEALELADTLQRYLRHRTETVRSHSDVVARQKLLQRKLMALDNDIFESQNTMISSSHEIDSLQRKLAALPDKNVYDKRLHVLTSRIKLLKQHPELNTADEDEDGSDEEFENGGSHMSSDVDEANEDDIAKYANDLKQESLESLESMFKSLKAEHRQSKKDYKNLNKRGIELEQINESAESHLAELTAQKVSLLQEPDTELEEYSSKMEDLEFTIQQLFLVARDYDFSDELARRNMLNIVRNSLANDVLSDSLVEAALKVLAKLSINEKDFVAMATEIITDIRDSQEDDEEFHSAVSAMDEDPATSDAELLDDEANGDELPARKKAKPSSKMPPDDIVIQCLQMTQHVLESVQEPLEANVQLESLYFSIVTHALSERNKYKLHTLGLKCLGLFALISESIAKQGLPRFYHAVKSYGQEVGAIAMQSIVDILATHGIKVIEIDNLFQYARLFHKCLNQYDSPKMQGVVAEGLCKLFLADLFAARPADDPATESEKELFESLVMCFFDPRTRSNPELKQILAFCIPVYAFSHPKHQFRVASVSGDAMFRLYHTLDEGADSPQHLSPSTVVQQLIHWCDPNNLVNLTQVEIKRQTSHLWQAVYLLQAVEAETTRTMKRAILSNLNRMVICPDLPSNALEGLLKSIEDTKEVLHEKSDEPDFNIDKPTWRQFEAFEKMVEQALQDSLDKSMASTGVSRNSSRVSSRSGSRVSSRSGSIPPDIANDSMDKDNFPGDSAPNKLALSAAATQNDTEIDGTQLNSQFPEPSATVVDEVATVVDNPNVSATIPDTLADLDSSHTDEIVHDNNRPTPQVVRDSAAEKVIQDQGLESSLAEIDQMLDDEDEVDYDISLE
ncbi:condensin complex subunit 3 [Diutina catenulata]